ncbi:hypothetical protein Taro_055634 [Colocasia esculenta]|uniref:Uncharacterized protein n=1 Tax=Colocasia esculenta TaxID=4460 RepID=A0A843XU90_COLES|nr:hypothetical protein [Colocasia esculenta]
MELPSSPASSYTQESARHFIEATWVPLHRVGQEARTVGLSLSFSAPRGRIRDFSGSKGTSAILSFTGMFLQFYPSRGHFCNFLRSKPWRPFGFSPSLAPFGFFQRALYGLPR